MAPSPLTAIYDFLSLGNVFLLFISLLMLHYFMVLFEFRNMPPGPRFTTIPVLGNLLSLDPSAETLSNIFKSLTKNYGPIFSLKMGSYKFVMASSREAVHEMLVKKSADYAGRPQTYAFYTQTLGGKDIVMGNYGPQWKKQRKLFTAALRQYLLDVPLIERRVATQAEKLVQFMEEQNGKPFNPSDCLMRSVANVICGITFGEGEDTTNPELDRLLKLNADFIANDEDLRLATILEFFSWARYLPLKVYDRVLQPLFEIHDIIRKIFRLRAKEFDPTEPVENLISGLLRAKYETENEPDDEMRDVQLSEDHFVITIEDMFVGGYETTSTTLKWVIALLVRYPEHQKDIQRQLDEVIGAEKSPSLHDRSSLPLVLATVMETLRIGNLLPIALPHVTLTDTTLCGYRVPKDTIVFANTESIHLDPKFWEDPTVFNPYRHLDKDGKLITNQGNFYPFGAGRRVCAGEALAKVELFMFVSWMLQKFTFIADEGHPVNTKGAFVQFPSAYKIRAIKRQ